MPHYTQSHKPQGDEFIALSLFCHCSLVLYSVYCCIQYQNYGKESQQTGKRATKEKRRAPHNKITGVIRKMVIQSISTKINKCHDLLWLFFLPLWICVGNDAETCTILVGWFNNWVFIGMTMLLSLLPPLINYLWSNSSIILLFLNINYICIVLVIRSTYTKSAKVSLSRFIIPNKDHFTCHLLRGWLLLLWILFSQPVSSCCCCHLFPW